MKARTYAKKTFQIPESELDAWMDENYIGFFSSSQEYLDSLDTIEDRHIFLCYEKQGEHVRGVHMYRFEGEWRVAA